MTNSVMPVRPFAPCAEPCANDHSTRAPARQTARKARSVAIAAPLLALAALIGACRAAPQPAFDFPQASADTAPGRWDDLAGALSAVQREHELALLGAQAPAPGVRVYTLLSVLDERVSLRVETPTPGQPATTADLDVRAAYGLWGDPPREQAIILTFQRSLELQRQRRLERRR